MGALGCELVLWFETNNLVEEGERVWGKKCGTTHVTVHGLKGKLERYMAHVRYYLRSIQNLYSVWQIQVLQGKLRNW